jgi:hypothetical protein
MREAIENLLRQAIDHSTPFDKLVEQAINLAAQCRTKLNAPNLMNSA